MMLNKKDLVVASAAALGIASVGFADLLGLNTDFPFLFYSTTQPTATNYDASTDLFMVTSSPVAIFVAPGDPPAFVNPATCPGSSGEVLSMEFIVDDTGSLTGGIPGDDLSVVGEVDLGGLGFFCGVLLTGEVQAFGWEDTDPAVPGTDQYDMIFTVTGGQLAPILFQDSDIGVILTSENSTFSGSFGERFTGQAKGNLFPIPGGPGGGGPDLDIKPTSCPSSWNPGGNGLMPVALVGTDDFDVTEVDLSSLLLTRADGVGGAVAPNEGPPGPSSTYEDAATPFLGDLCDCHELGGDGILDIVLKFRTSDVASILELDGFPLGSQIELVLSGQLLDGTPFAASDCVRIAGPGGGVAAVNLTLNGPNEAYMMWDVADHGNSNDTFSPGVFNSRHEAGSAVTYSAPNVLQDGLILRALRVSFNGGSWLSVPTNDATILMPAGDVAIEANFIPIISKISGGPIGGPIGGL
ncbi:MAG: hypothetical protein ACYTG1_03290 [Planctomycetota bacterium]|jgi:hypothetical protein